MVSRIAPQAVIATASKKTFALISDEILKNLYVAMLECRLLEDKTRTAKQSRKVSNESAMHRLREATAVGVCMHLLRDDTVAMRDRNAMLEYIKGISLPEILSQFLPTKSQQQDVQLLREGAAASPRLLALHTTVAAQLNIANGLALASRMQESQSIVTAFSREFADVSHDTLDALSFAAKHRLPILFVVHHDLPASDGQEEQRDLSSQIQCSGVPCIPVDGQDVVAVYRVAQEAITRARQQGGPTVIDALSFPESSNAALHTATDSLAHMEKYLAGKGLFSEKWKQQRLAAFSKKLEATLRKK